MKILFAILSLLGAGVAQAHESLAPHRHPHVTNMLPDSETLGIAILMAALVVIALAQFKRG